MPIESNGKIGGKATFGSRRLECLTMALRNNPPSDHGWEYKKERPLVRTTDRSYFHQRLAEIYSAKTNNHQPADHQPAHGMTRHVAPEDLLKPNFALHRTSLAGPTYFDNAAKPLLPQLGREPPPAPERRKLVVSCPSATRDVIEIELSGDWQAAQQA